MRAASMVSLVSLVFCIVLERARDCQKRSKERYRLVSR